MKQEGADTAKGKSRYAGKYWGLVLKISISVCLLYWLVRSDALRFSELDVLISSSTVFGAALLTWLLNICVLSSLRWKALLVAGDIEISFGRALVLQCVAFFLNALVPGNVGGDFYKNHAVLGGEGGKLVVLVLAERVLGLVAMVWTLLLGLPFALQLIRQNSPIVPSLILQLLCFLGALFLPLLAIFAFRRLSIDDAAVQRDPTRTVGKSLIFAWLTRTYLVAKQATRSLAHSPQAVFRAFLLSLAMHCVNLWMFWVVARHIHNANVGYTELALIYPIGMLSLALPISISGMGVGHLMFEKLFEIFQLARGADVFNVYMVGVLAPHLIGGLFFLILRFGRKKTAPCSSGIREASF